MYTTFLGIVPDIYCQLVTDILEWVRYLKFIWTVPDIYYKQQTQVRLEQVREKSPQAQSHKHKSNSNPTHAHVLSFLTKTFVIWLLSL